jgi:transposase
MRIQRAKISSIIGVGKITIEGGRTMARSQDNTIVSVVHAICCGLDVHKESISACLLVTAADGRESHEIRKFGTFTRDLRSLRDWLLENDCPIVAIESTGIYWRPVLNVLEDQVKIVLVNARHFKNVPGKKTDVADCQWLAGLLRHGLLRGSFIPPAEVRDWRDWTRLRKSHLQTLGDYKRRTHKLLESANIKLDSVVSELFGQTGRSLLHLLASSPDRITRVDIDRCAKGKLRVKKEALFQAIQGFFREHHRDLLHSLLRTIDLLEAEIALIEQRLQGLLQSHQPVLDRLDEIPGIAKLSASAILAEIGPTLEEFPRSAALASWAGLCPGNHESAGKRKNARHPVRVHHLKTILIEVAWAAVKKKGSYYKDKFHRLKARRGPKKAIVAIAHRLLKAIYHIIKEGRHFKDLGENYLTLRNQAAKLNYLKKQAQLLGFHLAPLEG